MQDFMKIQNNNLWFSTVVHQRITAFLVNSYLIVHNVMMYAVNIAILTYSCKHLLVMSQFYDNIEILPDHTLARNYCTCSFIHWINFTVLLETTIT